MALDDREIGEKIRNVREVCNLTQTQFANRLHMAQQTLSRYENGKSTVPNEILAGIAQEFDISLNYFFGVEAIEFSDDELLLIELYRKSDDRIKKRIFELVKVLTDDQMK